jgi:hypothetical protein
LDQIIEVGPVRSRESRQEPLHGLVMTIEELSQRIAVTTSARLDQLLLGVGWASLHVLESYARSTELDLSVTVLGSVETSILPVGAPIGPVSACVFPVRLEIGSTRVERLAIGLHGIRIAGCLVGCELRLVGADRLAVFPPIDTIGLAVDAIGLVVGAILLLVAGSRVRWPGGRGRLCD